MISTVLSSLTIRPKLDGDAEFIRRLSEKVFSEYARGAGAYTLRLSEGERATTVIATLGAKAVGFAVLSFAAPAATLLAIAVDPSSRGLGIGKQLLAAIENEARREGAKVLTLATAEANVAALDLFLRSGYRMTGRLFRYYGRGQNAVGMRKRL